MGLILAFRGTPTPRVGDVADNGLSTLVHRHVLHAHRLMTRASVSLQRLDLGGERPSKFVEGPLGAVLLRDVLHVIEAAREGHYRGVSCCHLSREHCLHLIARFHAFDDGEQEIQTVLIDSAALRANIAELVEKPLQEVRVRRSERFHEQLSRQRA